MTNIRAVLNKILPDPALDALKAFHYRRSLPRLVSEEEDIWVVAKYALPGSTVIDIGANIGVYTYALSRAVGSSGTVLSFEPMAKSFRFLSSNVRAHQLSNVRAFNLGLSDHETEAQMKVPSFQDGGSNFYQAKIVQESTVHGSESLWSVQLSSLDKVLGEQDVAPPRFIKIDVEGHELPVIRGALNTIQTARPTLFVEVSGNPAQMGSPAAQLISQMENLGYDVMTVKGGEVRAWRDGQRAVNYLFLPRSQS